MKAFSKYLFFALFVGVSVIPAFASIVGKKAPNFSAQAVIDGKIQDISLQDFEGKNKILVFYPADFSFICPTELFALQDNLSEFEKRNAILIAVSVDQIYSHQKWLNTPKQDGGVQGITYPIASDVTKKITQAYHVLDDQSGTALRGVFIIDISNIVQAAMIYNMSIGRNTQEILRVLDAVIFTQEHGAVCPANWQEGKDGMKATQKGLIDYLNNEPHTRSLDRNGDLEGPLVPGLTSQGFSGDKKDNHE